MYFLVVLGASLALAARSPTPQKPVDWLYSSEINDTTLALLDRPDIKGVQALYSWKLLEPGEGIYDFSSIQSDLQQVRAKGKKLWVQLQDRTFSVDNVPTPKYMEKPLYNNGSVPTCDGNCDVVFNQTGWMAVQWNQHVRHRYQKLLSEMAKELDGQIYGFNFPETSIAVDITKNGYSDEGYFEAELQNAKFGAEAFKNTFVVQYVNFWPDGWANNHSYFTRSFDFYAEHGVGVGGPDLIPFKAGQVANSYPFIYAYRDRVPISVVAVQEPDLAALNPKNNKTFTKEEFVDYATNDLAVKIIFWATSSPWLSEPVVEGY